MKIQWQRPTEEHPVLGLLQTGEVYVVEDALGAVWIDSGAASKQEEAPPPRSRRTAAKEGEE
jgi:hypothetical protein